MQTLWEILLQVVEILTLVFGILGLAVSMMLIFSPVIVQKLSRLANRQVDLEKRLAVLDRNIPTSKLVYSRPAVTGAVLIAASLFALVFFFFRLDVSRFGAILLGTRETSLLAQMAFEAAAWVGRVACLLGLACGVMLIAAPKKLMALEQRLDAWVETKPVVEKLNRADHDLDSVLYRHPLGFGITGAVISLVLVVLSLLNILD